MQRLVPNASSCLARYGECWAGDGMLGICMHALGVPATAAPGSCLESPFEFVAAGDGGGASGGWRGESRWWREWAAAQNAEAAPVHHDGEAALPASCAMGAQLSYHTITRRWQAELLWQHDRLDPSEPIASFLTRCRGRRSRRRRARDLTPAMLVPPITGLRGGAASANCTPALAALDFAWQRDAQTMGVENADASTVEGAVDLDHPAEPAEVEAEADAEPRAGARQAKPKALPTWWEKDMV